MNAIKTLTQAVRHAPPPRKPDAPVKITIGVAPEDTPNVEPVLPPDAAAYMTVSELNLRAPVAAMRLESRHGGWAWREWGIEQRRQAWAAASEADYTPEPEPERRHYEILPAAHEIYDTLKAAYPAHDATKWVQRRNGFTGWTFVELCAFLGVSAAVARVDAYARTPKTHGCRLLEDYVSWLEAATFNTV